jgi:hypothetical protein
MLFKIRKCVKCSVYNTGLLEVHYYVAKVLMIACKPKRMRKEQNSEYVLMVTNAIKHTSINKGGLQNKYVTD